MQDISGANQPLTELTRPFSRMFVIELAQMVAGPYCGRLLADMGADVIKVEPKEGDRSRQIALSSHSEIDYGALFLYCNGNKQSFVLEDDASGREVLHGLLNQADVLISDLDANEFRQMVGVDYDDIRERWPRLTTVCVRPYGLFGPLGATPGHELDTFHAGGEGKLLPGGLAHRVRPDGPPVKAGRYVAPYDSGMTAAALAAAALLHRELTGFGEFIDVSQQDVEVSINRSNLDGEWNAGKPVSRTHGGYDYGGVFQCTDGYITVLPNENHHWAGLARAMGREDLVLDERFAGRKARHDNGSELNAVLEKFFCNLKAFDAYQLVSQQGTPIAYFADAKAVYEAIQFKAREWFRSTDINGLKIDLPSAPYRMGLTPAKSPGSAPTLGQHTTEAIARSQTPPKTLAIDSVRKVQISDELQHRPGLLAGIRVVDTTWAVAGPNCTSILAQLGAEVIKIESAKRPDQLRRTTGESAAEFDRSTRFNNVNLNKQGITLNLQTEGGKRTLLQLVAISDLFVENFRPGVVERLGLSYDELRKVREDTVMVSLSAAGRGGPDSEQPGYARVFSAMGGLSNLTGYGDGPPTDILSSVDMRVGLAGAVAATSALLHRQRTGMGQWIDISAREVVASLIGDALVEYALTGVSPSRDGNHMAKCAPYDVFPCKGDDAWVAIAVCSDGEWRGLAHAMHGANLERDPRFSSPDLREQHIEELNHVVATWTLELTPHEATALCRADGVPASPVMSPADLAQDEHLLIREMIQDVVHPVLGPQKVVKGPWRINSPEPKLTPAPLLGEHTDSVLRGLLGLRDDELAKLRSEGALQ